MYRLRFQKEFLKSVLLFVMVCMIAFLGMQLLNQYDNKYSKRAALTQEGIVSLSPPGIQEGKLSFLVDGWRIYPDYLLTQEDFEAGGALPASYPTSIGQHPDLAEFHTNGDPYGCATYRIRLQSGETPIEAALYLPEVFCASRVYLDGELIGGLGELGENRYEPHVKDAAYSLTLQGNQELIIQTANYTHYYGGIYYPPALGSTQAISDMIAFRILFYGFLCFSSLAIALFSMAVWFGKKKRRDFLFLHFGVLSLSFALRVSYPFIRLAGLSAVRPLYALEDVAAFVGIYCTVRIVTMLCGLENDNIVRKLLFPITLGMCGVGVFIPMFVLPVAPAFIPVYGTIVSYYKLFTAFFLLTFALYGCVVGSRYARLLLSAVAVYGVCLFANVWNINYYEPVYTGWQDEYGSFLLVLLFATMMVRRSHAIMAENIRLTEHLHEEVQEKTKNMLLLVEERKTLLTEMMHDLKSPLTSILNYAQLIEKNDLLVDQEAQEQIQFIEKKCADMGERIRFLQTFTAENSLSVTMEPVSLPEILERFHRSNQPDIEVWGPDFKLELPLGDCKVFGDPIKILRMLENLVYNAASFTSPEGIIRLSLTCDKKWAYIAVSDTGIGIPEEKLDKIFERFYTSRAEEGGQGLGLAIVRQIALEHGGEVTAASKVGEGSTFTIRLPLLRDSWGEPI